MEAVCRQPGKKDQVEVYRFTGAQGGGQKRDEAEMFFKKHLMSWACFKKKGLRRCFLVTKGSFRTDSLHLSEDSSLRIKWEPLPTSNTLPSKMFKTPKKVFCCEGLSNDLLRSGRNWSLRVRESGSQVTLLTNGFNPPPRTIAPQTRP